MDPHDLSAWASKRDRLARSALQQGDLDSFRFHFAELLECCDDAETGRLIRSLGDAFAGSPKRPPIPSVPQEILDRVRRVCATFRSGRVGAGPYNQSVYVALLWGVGGLPNFSFYVGKTSRDVSARQLEHETPAGWGGGLGYCRHFLVSWLNDIAPHLLGSLSWEDVEGYHKDGVHIAGFEVRIAEALRREFKADSIKVFGGGIEFLRGEVFDENDPGRICDLLSDDNYYDTIFQIPRPPKEDAQVSPLFDHQNSALRALRSGHSGIVSLPTGAGKTRLAITFLAEQLRDPATRVIWVSYPNLLLSQAAREFVNLAALLYGAQAEGSNRELKIVWKKNSVSSRFPFSRDMFDRADVFVMLRERWSELLDHPAFREALKEKHLRFVVVFDECHLMTGERSPGELNALGSSWLSATRTPEYRTAIEAGRLQVVGLSATPIPRNTRLVETVFPPRPANQRPDGWPLVHVHAHAEFRQLVSKGILCPPCSFFDEIGEFHIPAAILQRVIAPRQVEWLERYREAFGTTVGKGGGRRLGDVSSPETFCQLFTRSVMEDSSVVTWLAERLARHIRTLGKTLVFAPSIAAANLLADRLAELLNPMLPNSVFLVHSQLARLEHWGKFNQALSARRQEQAFKDRKDEPCVMVNVDMLTAGFDDPKIRTVVLARNTVSPNKFWQMVGRGLRGEKVKGTAACNVIDPVRLQAVFCLEDGYKPPVNENYFEQSRTSPEDVPLVCRMASTVSTIPTIRIVDRAIVDQPLSERLRRIVAILEAGLRGSPLALTRNEFEQSRLDLGSDLTSFHLSEGGNVSGWRLFAAYLVRARGFEPWVLEYLPATDDAQTLFEYYRALDAADPRTISRSEFERYLSLLPVVNVDKSISDSKGVSNRTAEARPAAHVPLLPAASERKTIDLRRHREGRPDGRGVPGFDQLVQHIEREFESGRLGSLSWTGPEQHGGFAILWYWFESPSRREAILHVWNHRPTKAWIYVTPPGRIVGSRAAKPEEYVGLQRQIVLDTIMERLVKVASAWAR